MGEGLREAVERLRALGLNQLEAEVYAYLLSHEPATAYAIGKAIRRPTANVYKAVEALSGLGAALVEVGESRVCRAVPVGEFIRHRERALLEQTQAAEQALLRLEKQTADERVYRIESAPEVVERAAAMLGRATKVAVVDAFPRALAAVREAVAEAAGRGVRVFVEAYLPVEIEGAEVVVVPDGERSLAAWNSEQLNVVVDGQEHLLALLSDDLSVVHQAVWSRSAYLSCIHHAGRMSEIALIGRMRELEEREGEASEALSGRWFFRNSDVPGHRELLRRFAAPAAKADATAEGGEG